MIKDRAFRRNQISLACPCRLFDGVRFEIELLDVSPRGCRARVEEGLSLGIGDALSLYPEGCEEFTATVRRMEGTFAGLEFDFELPDPVFERMRCYVREDTDGVDQPAVVLPQSAPDETVGSHGNAPVPVRTASRSAYSSLADIASPNASRSARAKPKSKRRKPIALS